MTLGFTLERLGPESEVYKVIRVPETVAVTAPRPGQEVKRFTNTACVVAALPLTAVVMQAGARGSTVI